ncbi:MAG: hypothetical protein KGH55_02750 [Nanoarchaeota archaeon]|nr:hypothetical protein [Nanoarchaeota archaeon]
MKKSVLLISFVIFLFSVLPLVFVGADVNSTQVDNAYSYLSNRTNSVGCSSLSTSQQIFDSLAIGACTNYLVNSSSNGCWPYGSCTIKTTSQGILAVNNAGLSVNQSLTWLLSQSETTPPNLLTWYLQINSNTNTTCSVSYSSSPGTSYSLVMNQDKTLSSGAGNCLTLSSNKYWLVVNPSCYGTQFSVSCDQLFTLSKLYQRPNFQTIYISGTPQSSSSGGTIADSVNSSCFSTGSGCDYEGSLWASLTLSSLNHDISPYLPYLSVYADDNSQYLPSAFLSMLDPSSPSYLQDLLSLQKTVTGSQSSQYYWDVSGKDRYYDTALALLALQNQDAAEKTNAINWLLSSQDSGGSWNSGDVLDTAFILYSVWGSRTPSSANLTADCVSSGHFCTSSFSCTQAGGTFLPGYTCGGTPKICCSANTAVPSCAAQDGQICNSTQICPSGYLTNANDTLSSGQICCLASCTIQQTSVQSDCEAASDNCRTQCLNGEQPSQLSCSPTGGICCVPSPSQSPNYAWIIILSVLIFLALIALVSRKKLRMLLLRFKSGSKGGKPSSAPPRGPPFPPFQSPMTFQRRQPIAPSRQQPPKSSAELNDVLKKLREMGK